MHSCILFCQTLAHVLSSLHPSSFLATRSLAQFLPPGPWPQPPPWHREVASNMVPPPTLAVAWQRLCSPDKCISPRSPSCQRSPASEELHREGEMKRWGLAGPGTVFQAEAQCRPRKARSATRSGDSMHREEGFRLPTALLAAAPLSLSFPICTPCKVHTQFSALGGAQGEVWRVRIHYSQGLVHGGREDNDSPEKSPAFTNTNKPRGGRDRLHPFPSREN